MATAAMLAICAIIQAKASVSEPTAPDTTPADGEVTVKFINLPYAEGTLFVAVNEGDKILDGKVVPVESDEVSVIFQLDKHMGKELLLRAFQDLDESNNIEFDAMGRPTEPVLQTSLKITPELHYMEVELIQY